jgi:hypothetical protein
MPELATSESIRTGGRINVRINDDTARHLTNLVVGDRSLTDVVRRALALLDLVTEEMQQGKTLQMVSGDGKTQQELRILF